MLVTQGLLQAKGMLYQGTPFYTPSQGTIINYDRGGSHRRNGYFGTT